MKNVLTALGNENVNNKLKQYKEIKILTKDIQYKEGIIEILEKQKEIDYIIISEILPGAMTIENLINTIKEKNNNINIIIILDIPNEELEKKLQIVSNVKIYYNNQIKIKEVAKLIINQNNSESLKKEIEKLNKIIKQKDIQIKTKLNDEEIEKEMEKQYGEKGKIIKLINNKKEKEEKNAKIITITGIGGVGKSIFTINLANILRKNKKKVLIVDLDIFNNSINTLLGIKKIEEVIEEYERFSTEKYFEYKKIKLNKYLNIIAGKDLIYINQRINEKEFVDILEQEKKKYDAIIIDTATELNFNYAKEIMKKSDKIIFLSEPNIIQIKKTKNILNIYLKNWNIQKDKINIIFNKVKEDSIDEEILKEIFKGYKILGIVEYIRHCNVLINNNMKNIFINGKIQKQYIKLQKKIFMNEKLKIYYLNKLKK